MREGERERERGLCVGVCVCIREIGRETGEEKTKKAFGPVGDVTRQPAVPWPIPLLSLRAQPPRRPHLNTAETRSVPRLIGDRGRGEGGRGKKDKGKTQWLATSRPSRLFFFFFFLDDISLASLSLLLLSLPRHVRDCCALGVLAAGVGAERISTERERDTNTHRGVLRRLRLFPCCRSSFSLSLSLFLHCNARLGGGGGGKEGHDGEGKHGGAHGERGGRRTRGSERGRWGK